MEIAAGAPERGLVVSNVTGTFQLHAWDVPSGVLRALTTRPTGTASGALAPDGRFVYYHEDTAGNELGHFVRVPFDGGTPETLTPGRPPYPVFTLGMSGAGTRLGFVTASNGTFHVDVIEIGREGKLGAPRRIYSTERLLWSPRLSHDGTILVVAASLGTRSLQFGLLALDAATGCPMGELSDGADSRLMPAVFSPLHEDSRLLAESNRTGVARPFLWDARRGTRVDLGLDALDGELYPVDWSPDGRRLLLEQVTRAVQHLHTYDLATGSLTSFGHHGGMYGNAYFASDDLIHVRWEDATHPPHAIVLDAGSGAIGRTLLLPSDAGRCRPWRSISFVSSDGQEIQGWLALPDGVGPFPTILHMHGGPEAVMTELFSPASQMWLDHGFAFLSVNYRGSTTFGRAFLERIWGDVGRWEVEDLVAARAGLVKDGIADPARVFLTGWSYGGYLTLQALGTRPDLWAGGMAGIAVADWAIAHEDTTDTLRPVRAARFGGPPEEQPARYAASSPITHAHNVTAPVLIIQGRNDTRTPPRSVEADEAKMRALGKTIEVHWFDAGHGPLVVEQAIDHHARMLDFATGVLQRVAARGAA
jgi:dienelactone hydrolase